MLGINQIHSTLLFDSSSYETLFFVACCLGLPLETYLLLIINLIYMLCVNQNKTHQSQHVHH
jgi:hypothetical protein